MLLQRRLLLCRYNCRVAVVIAVTVKLLPVVVTTAEAVAVVAMAVKVAPVVATVVVAQRPATMEVVD